MPLLPWDPKLLPEELVTTNFDADNANTATAISRRRGRRNAIRGRYGIVVVAALWARRGRQQRQRGRRGRGAGAGGVGYGGGGGDGEPQGPRDALFEWAAARMRIEEPCRRPAGASPTRSTMTDSSAREEASAAEAAVAAATTTATTGSTTGSARTRKRTIPSRRPAERGGRLRRSGGDGSSSSSSSSSKRMRLPSGGGWAAGAAALDPAREAAEKHRDLEALADLDRQEKELGVKNGNKPPH